jgi:hypothetical protein
MLNISVQKNPPKIRNSLVFEEISTLFFITLVPRPVQHEIMLFSETFKKIPKNPTEKKSLRKLKDLMIYLGIYHFLK